MSMVCLDFPIFVEVEASSCILNVDLSPTGKLHWPDLDIDLSTEILQAPERFPLIAK